MCDYSLELYRSQPAVSEEQYTLQRFPSGTMGFTTGQSCETAVCIPADARLRLQGIGEAVQRAFAVSAIEEVVMTRLEGGPHAHRDAVSDPWILDGKVVELSTDANAESDPWVSPDSHRMFFTSDADGENDLYVSTR